MYVFFRASESVHPGLVTVFDGNDVGGGVGVPEGVDFPEGVDLPDEDECRAVAGRIEVRFRGEADDEVDAFAALTAAVFKILAGIVVSPCASLLPV